MIVTSEIIAFVNPIAPAPAVLAITSQKMSVKTAIDIIVTYRGEENVLANICVQLFTTPD